jgi:hypothetical protein
MGKIATGHAQIYVEFPPSSILFSFLSELITLQGSVQFGHNLLGMLTEIFSFQVDSVYQGAVFGWSDREESK